MSTPCQHLFVYGTLRRRCRHPMADFLAARATFLGEGRVRGQLYDLGRYPAAVPSDADGDWVHGDLYDLGLSSTTLEDLDRYESDESPQPSYFERRQAEVVLAPDRVLTAWIYWFRGPMPGAVRLASGNYDKNFRPADGG